MNIRSRLAGSATLRALVDGLYPRGKRANVRGGVLEGVALWAPVLSGMSTYRAGAYESHLEEIVRRALSRTECGVFFDVGAHIGYWSLLVDRFTAGRAEIHAFEPDPVANDCLARNVAHLGSRCHLMAELHSEGV